MFYLLFSLETASGWISSNKENFGFFCSLQQYFEETKYRVFCRIALDSLSSDKISNAIQQKTLLYQSFEVFVQLLDRYQFYSRIHNNPNKSVFVIAGWRSEIWINISSENVWTQKIYPAGLAGWSTKWPENTGRKITIIIVKFSGSLDFSWLNYKKWWQVDSFQFHWSPNTQITQINYVPNWFPAWI